MPLVLRMDDPGSHGGKLCQAASRTLAEGKHIVRWQVDAYCCSEHSTNPPKDHCAHTYAEGRELSYNHAESYCDAVLHATAQHTFTE